MKTFFSALLCFGLLPCLAQKNFQPGFVVDNSGDTIKGFINFQERTKNPGSFVFKKELKVDASTTYSVADIRMYELEGLEQYVRCLCTISLSQSDIQKLPLGPDTTTKIENVFLRKIAGNDVALYTYTDKIKTRYFIQASTASAPTELLYRPYLSLEIGNFMMDDFTYRQQLTNLVSELNIKDARTIRSAQNVQYKRYELVQLVNRMNGPDARSTLLASKYKSTRFFIGGGLNNSSFKLSGIKATRATQYSFSGSTSPVGFVGLDYLFRPTIGRNYLRQELAYFSNQHQGMSVYNIANNTYTSDYRFTQHIVSIGSSFNYNFYQKPSFALYAAAGVAANLSIMSENEATLTLDHETKKEEPYEFDRFNVTANGRLGVILLKRWDANVLLHVPIKSNTTYVAIDDSFKYLQFRISYIFPRRK